MSESVEQRQRVDRAAAQLMEEWLGTNFVQRRFGPGPPNFEATARRVLERADGKPETSPSGTGRLVVRSGCASFGGYWYELYTQDGRRLYGPVTFLGKTRCRIWALAHGYGWISAREFNV